MTDTDLQTIRTLAERVDKQNKEIKTMREMATEIKEAMPEFAHFQELNEEMQTARKELQIALERNAKYTGILEKIGVTRNELKEDKYTLSRHLVEYYADTHEQQIPIDDQTGDARDLIVTGKLGKIAKYQTNIFNENKEADRPTN